MLSPVLLASAPPGTEECDAFGAEDEVVASAEGNPRPAISRDRAPILEIKRGLIMRLVMVFSLVGSRIR